MYTFPWAKIVPKLSHYFFRQWHITWLVPSDYLAQCLSYPKEQNLMECESNTTHVLITRVTHIYIYICKLISIGSNNGLSPGRRQAIILTDIVNWTLRNKLQWYFNRNSYILIQENAFENVVWKISAILSRPQFVKLSNLRHSYCCIMNRYKNTDSGTNKFKVHNDWHFSRSIYARGNVLPLR